MQSTPPTTKPAAPVTEAPKTEVKTEIKTEVKPEVKPVAEAPKTEVKPAAEAPKTEAKPVTEAPKPATEAPKTENPSLNTVEVKREPLKDEQKKAEPVADEKKEEDDEDDVPAMGKQGEGKQERKTNKGEKKCKKALIKLGMKPVTGISRVTIKKTDDVIFAISNPEVLKSATNDNCYVVFGQMSYEDPTAAKASSEAKQYAAKPEEKKVVAPVEIKKEEEKKKPVEEEVKKVEEKPEAPLSEEGITPMHIDMVMSHTKCTRNKAIMALRETKDDMVNAILKLSP
jgi:nascent polypeptide-associated complex subunit alpha